MAAPDGEGVALPKFDNPPVAEVVIALEFVPLQTLNTIELVRAHALWSDKYPRIVQQPPLAPTSQPSGLVAGFGLQIGGTPNIRVWMLSEDERQLLQLQNDRLILNWRRIGSVEYPSFDDLYPEFSARWGQLGQHLSSEAPQPVVAEVTYVNQIQAPGESRHDLSRICSMISEFPGPGSLESERAQIVAKVVGAQGHSVFTFEPDEVNGLIALTVTTRIAVNVPTVSGTMDPLDALHLAHRASVLGFANITTSEMHNAWGRTA